MIDNWLHRAHQTLFPRRCLLCGVPAVRELCAACHADLPHNRHACLHCAIPLPASAGNGGVCGPCQRRAPPFAACLAALRYEPPLDKLVTGLKFHGRLAYGRVLADLLGDYLQEHQPGTPQLIIPVPLHPARLRQRQGL